MNTLPQIHSLMEVVKSRMFFEHFFHINWRLKSSIFIMNIKSLHFDLKFSFFIKSLHKNILQIITPFFVKYEFDALHLAEYIVYWRHSNFLAFMVAIFSMEGCINDFREIFGCNRFLAQNTFIFEIYRKWVV